MLSIPDELSRGDRYFIGGKTWFLPLNREFIPLSKLRNQVFTVSILIRITIIRKC